MSNTFTPPSDDVFHHFISTPLDTLLAEHRAVNPEDKVLALFHRCAAEVPAYRRFLEARGVNPAEITSFHAFQGLPLMDKADYMQAYPLPERCLGGSLSGSDRVAVSSGSTGQSGRVGRLFCPPFIYYYDSIPRGHKKYVPTLPIG